ncbi:MAG TPA: alpha/beta hydrolase [Thermoanaerobaculia bacterium]|jgi:pimeloyl-ACP methyl ester carboxylesterase|nr:alpha/beta hydrolase [Thermoanaerobaculia bacterium]
MKTRRETCVFILLMLLAGALFAAGADSVAITGEWQGMVATQHLIVRIEQAGDGSYTGKLTAVDQGNVTIPVDTVSYTPAGALRLELKSIGAFYEATLGADGGELAGTWHQGGNSVPLSLHRPGAAPPKLTLKPRTIGSIPFEPCRTADGNTEGLCGKYEVYENRTLRSGRKIALNIMVLPALSDKPAADAWFPLGGGPGQSAVAAYPSAGFTVKVRQQRDVVLVDQRGTGGSNPLPCNLRDPKNPKELIGDSMPLDKVRACRAELEKKADLTQYTTSISADDIDDVRRAMGYDKINVFGASYGTLAGLVYLRRHGDHVRTLTLEAVATPNYRIPLPFARTTQSSVDGLIDRCAADAACNKNYPDLKKEFRAVVGRLEKSPAHFEVKNAAGEAQTVTLSRGMFVADLRPVLYIPSLVSQFPYFVHRAYQGDWSTYAAAVMAVRGAIDKAVDRGMSLSVVCAEAVAGITEAMIRRETGGTYLGDFQVRLYQKACHEWPRGGIPRDFYDPIHSAVPTLLISGALDPATPPEASAQAARDLSNSRVVVVKNGTHGTGSPCIDRLISEFVSQGSATGLDASCADQIPLPPFVTQAQTDH